MRRKEKIVEQVLSRSKEKISIYKMTVDLVKFSFEVFQRKQYPYFLKWKRLWKKEKVSCFKIRLLHLKLNFFLQS